MKKISGRISDRPQRAAVVSASQSAARPTLNSRDGWDIPCQPRRNSWSNFIFLRSARLASPERGRYPRVKYALHIRDQNGLGTVRKIDLGKPPSFFYAPAWSPDNKKIAYSDKRLNLWYIEMAGGKPVLVDTNIGSEQESEQLFD